MALFSRFQPPQRERLRARFRTREWREITADSGLVAHIASQVRTPPGSPSQSSGTAAYLKERNEASARGLMDSGVRDAVSLIGALGDWQAPLLKDPAFPIHFLGLVLTLDCNLDPRCLYCNQAYLETGMGLGDWKAILDEAADPLPPYVYLTGGEPLLLGESVWGDDGLIAHAVRRGCAVNINTNATLLTARVALQLAQVGCARLHISVDTADKETQAELFRGESRVRAVWRGIHNVLIARELLGVNHPQIHINCVVTRKNAFQFPDTLRRLLETRPVPTGPDPTADPAFADFAFHLIPVGGPSNAPIRPTADEWRRFYTETWEQADTVWREHQEALRIPADRQVSLAGHIPYANPYLRVEHHMSFEDYCERAAQGTYWQGALTDRCYVAPGQAFVMPDGAVQLCGAHAIRRPLPIGNVREGGLRAAIRRGVGRLDELPLPECASCAGATCAMNQSIERNLRQHIADMLAAGTAA